MDRKMLFLSLLGAVFLLLGLYYRFFDPVKSDISYEYLGIGTWSAGVIFYAFYPKYREVVSFILGLLILHAGVLLLLREISNTRPLGALVFTGGVVIILSSGFSDYMKKRKQRARS